ncbi:spore germination protein [Paenibacillus lentus]|uniref:Spore germination protein n=1 Tax=Paenibacillus lentus TaxID=1338368 RepID=A0A3Q8SAY7_9BACL|nr:spore germination protein [Paenibacillus lentus]AZK46420.1 spore germination protein [Paenibacillus lentus]
MSVILSYIPKWSIFGQALLLIAVPILIMSFFGWLRKEIISSFALKPNKSFSSVKENDEPKSKPLTGQYDADLASVRDAIGQNSDVRFREFKISGTRIRAAIVYVDGLLDADHVDTHLITPLMMHGIPDQEWDNITHSSTSFQQYMTTQLLPVNEVNETKDLLELTETVLTGRTALLIEGIESAFLVSSPQGKSRNVEEPLSEALLRGPRIGFTERLGDNTGLLRLHGKNESLILSKFEVGNRVKKELVLAYMRDIADQTLIDEVTSRIQKIDIDDPLESGYIEQLIEDDVLSPFQQLQNTERPDRVIASLLEGRVAILLDGTPFALILPATFGMLLQSPEDYYERWIPGSFVRILRFLAALLALLAPALYISFISFHPGLIPTKLALSIIETRQGVPFPSIIEALIMELSIEILREAGIRLPKPIGPAMGIVGGLIIGDAAVNAGIVSPFLVIVVAVTAISSFTIPVYSAGITLRILRFVGMIIASILGIFGVVMFFLLICSHLVKLKSFGVPYLSPMVPYTLDDWKDFLVRLPLKVMKKRPHMLKPNDPDRRN